MNKNGEQIYWYKHTGENKNELPLKFKALQKERFACCCLLFLFTQLLAF